MKLAEMIFPSMIVFPACFLLSTSQAAVDSGTADGAPFQPATSLRESLEHHRNFIRDDIWWTVFAGCFKDDDHSEMDLGEPVLGMLHSVYGLAAPLGDP